MLLDTQGNILSLKVTTADVQDRDGAQLLLNVLAVAFGWLKLIWANGGYAGKLVDHVAGIARHRRVKLEIEIRIAPPFADAAFRMWRTGKDEDLVELPAGRAKHGIITTRLPGRGLLTISLQGPENPSLRRNQNPSPVGDGHRHPRSRRGKNSAVPGSGFEAIAALESAP